MLGWEVSRLPEISQLLLNQATIATPLSGSATWELAHTHPAITDTSLDPAIECL